MTATKLNAKEYGLRRSRVQVELTLVTINFVRICGLNGLKASEVPRQIARSKVQLYRALRNPRQHKPTIRLLENLLPIRKAPNGH